MYLVGFIIRIYHDAQPPERQKKNAVLQVLKIFLISSRKYLPQNKLKVSRRAPPGFILLSITLNMRATEHNTGKKIS